MYTVQVPIYYNISAYICNLYHVCVILIYFLDLDLKTKDSFRTRKHRNSHPHIYNVHSDHVSFFFFLALDKSQIFLRVSRGESQVLFIKAFLATSCAILMNYCILATKNPHNSATKAQIFLLYTITRLGQERFQECSWV